MYTVLRFLGDEVTREAFSRLGAKLNETQPGVFGGEFHRRCNGFSCGVSNESDWDSHVEQVEKFLVMHEAVLRLAKDSRVELELDIAVHPASDVPSGCLSLTLSLSRRTMQLLLDCEISLTLTIYSVEQVLADLGEGVEAQGPVARSEAEKGAEDDATDGGKRGGKCGE